MTVTKNNFIVTVNVAFHSIMQLGQTNAQQAFDSRIRECPMFCVIITGADSSIINCRTLSTRHQFQKHFQHHHRAWSVSQSTQQNLWQRWIQIWV